MSRLHRRFAATFLLSLLHLRQLAAFTPGSSSSVAIIGSGAVGSYYGARLRECGHDVKFLLRDPTYQRVCNNGMRIESVDGDCFIPGDEADTFYDRSSSIGEVDFCIIAVKGTAETLNALKPLISPVVGARTTVIAIMNGFVDGEICRMVPPETPVFGAMAFTCCSKVPAEDEAEPYAIEHSKYGALTIGLAGQGPGGGSTANKALLENRMLGLWEGSNVSVKLEKNLRRGRWEKSLWNLPFNGLCVAQGGITVDKVVLDATLRAEAKAIMSEVAVLGNADLKRQHEEEGGGTIAEPLGETEMTKLWELTDTMGPYSPSTMLDLVAGATLETPFLFDYPVKRASELGVRVPHLEHLVRQIHTVAEARDLT
jgi:2-dehydropantoate 2-reductase